MSLDLNFSLSLYYHLFSDPKVTFPSFVCETWTVLAMNTGFFFLRALKNSKFVCRMRTYKLRYDRLGFA